MIKVCPKCGYKRGENDSHVPEYQCPSCDVVYKKFIQRQKAGRDALKMTGSSGSDLVVECYDEIKNWAAADALFEMEYIDANDVITTRVVKVVKIARYRGVLYLYGFCQLRKEHRVFRADRVKACVDLETGEVVKSIDQYFRYVRDYDAKQSGNKDKSLAFASLAEYKTNHILHLLLSIITAGLWLIIWFFISFKNLYERNAIRRNYDMSTEINIPGIMLSFIAIVFVFVIISNP